MLLALADAGTGVLAPKWQYEQAKASGYHATPAIASDGSVLLGISGAQNPSTTVYAFKAPASGAEPQVAWQYDMGPGRMTSSITVGPDGTQYAIGGEGQMAALGSDGKPK